MGRLDGRVAIVTGAGGGIGREHALLLGREGAAVVVDDIGTRTGADAEAVAVRIRAEGGAAVATTTTAAAPTADQTTTLATLSESKLMTLKGAQPSAKATVQSTAPLVLLVLGDHVDPTILAGIVQGTATRAHGVVVAGSTGSGLRGDLKRLRAHDLGAQAPTVATVDGDDRNIGQVATVLALVHQVAGGGGAYGASGIDGVAPLG